MFMRLWSARSSNEGRCSMDDAKCELVGEWLERCS